MREPLGEWADKEIVIEDEEPLITEEEIEEDLNEGTDEQDIYDEKKNKTWNRRTGQYQ